MKAEEKELEIQQQLAAFDQLKSERDRLAQEADNNKGAYVQLTGLIKKGFVVQDKLHADLRHDIHADA